MKKYLYILILFLLIQSNNLLFSTNKHICLLKEIVWLEQEWAIDHWQTYFKEISYYDENNNLIKEISQIMNKDIWTDSRKTLYYYNENYSLIKKETYVIEDENWELTDSINYFYDSSNKIIEYIQRLKIEDTWNDYLKYNYLYDDLGNDTLEIKWKFIDNEWAYFYKLHKYYENSKKTHTILYTITNNEWIQKSKNEYTYKNDLLDNIINYAWINFDWMYSSRTLYLYDEKNRLVEQIYQLPSDTGWESQQSYATIYDAEGNEAVLITYQWRNGVKEGYQRSIRESYLSYDEHTESLPRFQIFPNPTEDIINISYKFSTNDKLIFCIYNALGNLVYSIDNINAISDMNNITLDLSHLENGTYFLVLDQNGIKAIKHFFKIK